MRTFASRFSSRALLSKMIKTSAEYIVLPRNLNYKPFVPILYSLSQTHAFLHHSSSACSLSSLQPIPQRSLSTLNRHQQAQNVFRTPNPLHRLRLLPPHVPPLLRRLPQLLQNLLRSPTNPAHRIRIMGLRAMQV